MVKIRIAAAALALSTGCQLYGFKDACGPGYDGGDCVIPTAATGASTGQTGVSGTSGSTTAAASSSGSATGSSTGATAGASTAASVAASGTTSGTTVTGVSVGATTSGNTTAAAASTGATSGATGGTTGAPVSAATTSSSGGSTGSTSGSTTGSTTTGGTLPTTCGPGTTWAGDACVLASCATATFGASCLLGAQIDAGLGGCYGGQCLSSASFQSDNSNCGTYGQICPVGTQCVQGDCTSGGNEVLCGGGGTCPSGTTCSAAWADKCVAICDSLSVGAPCDASGAQGFCCGVSSCLPVANSDANNCGACGNVCSGGEVCVAGSCVPPVSCEIGENGLPCVDAGFQGVCCQGSCTDTSNDPQNCGECARFCPTGATCSNGSCLAGGSQAECSAGCPLHTSCYFPSFPICTVTGCVAQLDGILCTPPSGVIGTCCDQSCTQLSSDPQNCGACGVVCPSGSSCANYACTKLLETCSEGDGTSCTLDAGFLGQCCDGHCADLSSDAHNCGSCGWGCPDSLSCSGGQCSADTACTSDASCPTGTGCSSLGSCLPLSCGADQGGNNALCIISGTTYGHCCGTTCTNANNDRDNCEGCGLHCSPGATCTGVCSNNCVTAGCATGQYCPPSAERCETTSCAGVVDGFACAFGPNTTGTCCGGACVDTTQDPENCSGCGLTCPTGSSCVSLFNGADFSASCQATAPSLDCLQTCPTGSACYQGACISGICTHDGNPNCFARDGVIGNCCGEACADFQTDPLNCGRCGFACGAGQTCANGTCSGTPSCGPGHRESFCNDGGACCPGLGCVDELSDPSNCGACGYGCDGGATCANGACQ